MTDFNHFNDRGEAHMVDVGAKPKSERVATARGSIQMQASTLALIQSGGHKKGDVLAVARIAAIMASKKTPDLIPLCHPIALTNVEVEFEILPEQPAIACRVVAKTTGQTGVEMEALTAVNVALLTIYDMCKAVDRGMLITDIGLLYKSGGKSGVWSRS